MTGLVVKRVSFWVVDFRFGRVNNGGLRCPLGYWSRGSNGKMTRDCYFSSTTSGSGGHNEVEVGRHG